jgi:hypothetical protein
MEYSYIEIEYVATNFSPARTDLALKLLIERGTASKCVYFVRSKLFYSMSLNSLSISCTRKNGNFLSAFCEGIYLIPMLYPRKLCKFEETIVGESVEFSGKHSFTVYPSLDPYRPTEFV